MAAQELSPHPTDIAGPARRLSAECARMRDGSLVFRFCASGAIERMRLPMRRDGARQDGLWKTTCFEAFLGMRGGSYIELNFSPSTDWAAYDFSAYRESMRDSASVVSIDIAVNETPSDLALTATVRLAASAAFSDLGGLMIGLSAVIEDVDGNKSHWAIAHPAAKPDFHHPDGFVYRLGDSFAA